MKQLLYRFIERGTEWLFRRQFIGTQLLKYGIAILVATLGLDVALGAEYKSGDTSFAVRVSTGSGLPALATNFAYALGVFLVFLGVGLLIRQILLDIRKERRQLLIVVELRGLHNAPDTPAKDVILQEFLGHRQNIVIDFRPQVAGERVNPQLVLEKMASLMHTIRTLASGRDSADVFVAVGGLAAVPALFLAGALLGDESNITIFDWSRDLKAWRIPDGPDDGKRFLPVDTTGLATGCQEAVLVVSCSYDVPAQQVATAFAGIPVVRLDAEEKVADRFWSEQKQAAFVKEFRDAVQQLLNHGVKRIHVLVAAPVSLSIRMGMTYDGRLHPDVIVYQYESSVLPVYPWGLSMPNDRHHHPAIIRIA